MVSNSSWYTWNFRLGVLHRLRELGAEVYVISPHDHYSTKLIAEGFHFVQLPIAVYSTNPLRELWGLFKMIHIYRKYRFDFIFHYTVKPNIYGTIAAWYCHIPSIAITTGLGLIRDEGGRFAKAILLVLYKVAAKLSKQVWFLNKDDQQYFWDKNIVSPGKSFILPSEGVNIDWYRPRESTRVHKTVRFLYAGRIVWSKGIREFYEAARYFQKKGYDCSFHLLGFIVPDHPDAVSFDLVQQWQAEGILRFHGETEDIRPFLAEADCIVLPSYHEGVSRLLLEAASMARPIITTDTMGCREVVEHSCNGLLCKAKDSVSLIQTMETFLAMLPEERNHMGIEGRKRVLKEFDEDIVIRHYIKALEHFLGWPARKKKSRAV